MLENNPLRISSVAEFIAAIQTTTNTNIPSILWHDDIMKKHLSDLDHLAIERGKAYYEAVKSDLKSEMPQKRRWFYRGHYSSDFVLLPSVFRGSNWEKEDYYYHEIAVRSPEHFQGKSHLDKLVTMQHYDCPTRLLDITSNPLVALFFACMNYGCPKCDKVSEGSVFVFSQVPKNVVYSDSDRALMLSCLSRFSKEDKEELYRLAHERLHDDTFRQVKGGSRYQDGTVENLYHEITRENPAFKREMRPLDLLQPLFVQPNKTNMRISKQDGAFILCGLSENANEATEKIEMTVSREVRVRNQEKILGELDALGINEASLFPELDKVAHYLKTRR